MYQELQENADVANEKRSELDQQNAKLKAELRRLEVLMYWSDAY